MYAGLMKAAQARSRGSHAPAECQRPARGCLPGRSSRLVPSRLQSPRRPGRLRPRRRFPFRRRRARRPAHARAARGTARQGSPARFGRRRRRVSRLRPRRPPRHLSASTAGGSTAPRIVEKGRNALYHGHARRHVRGRDRRGRCRRRRRVGLGRLRRGLRRRRLARHLRHRLRRATSSIATTGNGTLRPTSRATRGLESPGWNTGAAFFDADGDGDLDVYIAAYIDATIDDVLNAKRTLSWKGVEMVAFGPFGLKGAPDHFFRNDGHGRFVDATRRGRPHRPARSASASRSARPTSTATATSTSTSPTTPTPTTSIATRATGTSRRSPRGPAARSTRRARRRPAWASRSATSNGDGVLDIFVTNFAEDFATLYAGGPAASSKTCRATTGIGPLTFKAAVVGHGVRRSRQRRRPRPRRRQRPHLPAGRPRIPSSVGLRAAEPARREPGRRARRRCSATRPARPGPASQASPRTAASPSATSTTTATSTCSSRASTLRRCCCGTRARRVVADRRARRANGARRPDRHRR